MLVTIKTYNNMRRRGISRAWEISGMADISDIIVGWTCYIISVVGIMFLISDYANASQAATASEYKSEIEELRKIVASCLGDKAGVIVIGDEYHLCQATSIGEKRK